MRLDKMSRKPLYEQVVYGIKQDILKGILDSDDKLPSVRELASELLINPNTISKAYKQLEAEGIILTIRGKGTFVAPQTQIIQDDRKIQEIKNKINELVLEAIYQKIEVTEFVSYVTDYYETNGGKNNEGRELK